MHGPPEMPRWRRYVRFWRSNIAADVDDELQFHVQERIDDLVARGWTPDAARVDALRRFGDIERVRTDCRNLAQAQEDAMRRTENIAVMRQDVHYALRLIRGNPGFAAAVVLTLALGIGATTAIFSVVNSVLLHPLPFADGERIVSINERYGTRQGLASVGHFHDWTERTTAFAATAAWTPRTFNVTDGEPERVSGARVTPSFFDVFVLRPALGRYFRPDETEASRVAVISHPLWQTRYAGDSAIVGRDLTLNGETHTIIGVTPAEFTLTPLDERLWAPLSFDAEQRGNYGAHLLAVTAKLKPGVSLQQAQLELEQVTEDIRRRHPDEMANRGVLMEPFTETLVGDFRAQLWVLLGAVSFVLLIGCANVASLLLARATARRKEIAIRGALGGARGRLVRQLLTESLCLALLGGVAGLGVAHVGLRFLVGGGPSWVPRLQNAGLDLTVLGFAFLATLVCGLLFGLAPALRATRVDLQNELRIGGRSGTGLVHDRTRAALIVTEFAVALLLLVSAGLFVRSALRLARVPLGFDPAGVTMVRVALPADRYADAEAVHGAFIRMVDRVRALPGVQHAAASTRVPMWGSSIDISVRVDGRPADPNRLDIGHVRLVTARFGETMGIPLKRGRQLRDADLAAGAPWVVVVNEAFVRQTFGDEDPIGKRISGWAPQDAPQWREIVGVVGDVRAFGQANEQPPEIYMPLTQTPDGAWNAFQRSVAIVARGVAGTTVASPLRAAVRDVDALLPVYDVQTMGDVVAQSTADRRFNTTLLLLLGITGLVLAAIGIYGVIAFFVTQRTQEIGVRIALGANRRRVVGLVVSQAVSLAVIGIALGGVAAYWATQVFERMLFQVGTRDPFAYAAAAGVLLLVTIAAAWIPARRASLVDPVKALAASV